MLSLFMFSTFQLAERSTKGNKKTTSSPRPVLIIESDSEHWMTPGKKTTKTKSKRKATAARQTSVSKGANKDKAKTRSVPHESKVSTTTRTARSVPQKASLVKPTSATSKLPRPTPATSKLPPPTTNSKRTRRNKSPPPLLKSTGVKLTESEARKKLSRKPPTGRKPAAKKPRSKSSPRSKGKTKASAYGTDEKSTAIPTRGKSAVVGGNTGERTTAHLDNCFVAVHSIPKGKIAPIVTVDINPTTVECERSEQGRSRSPANRGRSRSPVNRGRSRSPAKRGRSRSVVRAKSPQRAISPRRKAKSPHRNSSHRASSPLQRSSRRGTSPLRLSPIRSPRDTTLQKDRPTAPDAGLSKTKEDPLCVSDSLDELLASSRDRSRGLDGSHASERVSQWLEDSSRYNLSGRHTPLNNTTISAKYALEQSYSPALLENSCKRSLESDFDEDMSPVCQSAAKRSRLDRGSCSCGVCRRCGKAKTPRNRRHGSESRHGAMVPSMPSMPTWCNLI